MRSEVRGMEVKVKVKEVDRNPSSPFFFFPTLWSSQLIITILSTKHLPLPLTYHLRVSTVSYHPFVCDVSGDSAGRTNGMSRGRRYY
jgi:hypothetical protein